MGLLPPPSMTPKGIQENRFIDIKHSKTHRLILELSVSFLDFAE